MFQTTDILEFFLPAMHNSKQSNCWVHNVQTHIFQWPFQEPKLEVPTIYKTYVRLL